MALPVIDCINCETKLARHASHYCSDKCAKAFLRRQQGPIQCTGCDAEFDTVVEARRAKWKDIVPDAEGMTWNYLGTCPECWAKENTPC